MQKFTAVTGTAAPLMKANIDTDVIIPAKRLVGHQRDQLGAFAFEAYRYRPDRTDNPDFVLNQPRYRDAQVLVTGENFGCGSSRESAVWALAGIRHALRHRAGLRRHLLQQRISERHAADPPAEGAGRAACRGA